MIPCPQEHRWNLWKPSPDSGDNRAAYVRHVTRPDPLPFVAPLARRLDNLAVLPNSDRRIKSNVAPVVPGLVLHGEEQVWMRLDARGHRPSVG